VIKSRAASEGSGKGSARYRKWRDIRGIKGNRFGAKLLKTGVEGRSGELAMRFRF
jgi:hypothetical protein